MDELTITDHLSVRIGKTRKQRMIALCRNTGLSISKLTQQAIDRELQRIASEILQEYATNEADRSTTATV